MPVMVRKVIVILWVIWLVVALGILAMRLVGFDAKPDGDLAVAKLMLLLSFPSGSIAALLTAWLIGVFGLDLPLSRVNSALQWSVLFLAGVFQWFVIPLWARRQYHKSRRVE